MHDKFTAIVETHTGEVVPIFLTSVVMITDPTSLTPTGALMIAEMDLFDDICDHDVAPLLTDTSTD